jgi:hypothetical protein
VRLEDPGLVLDLISVPGQPVERQLSRWNQRETLVVGLVQRPLLVEQGIRPFPPIAGDSGEEHEVVIPPGDLERVELERADPLDDGHHARRFGRQGAGRREEVADREEAPGDLGRDRQGWGHVGMIGDQTCQVPSGIERRLQAFE